MEPSTSSRIATHWRWDNHAWPTRMDPSEMNMDPHKMALDSRDYNNIDTIGLQYIYVPYIYIYIYIYNYTYI